MPVIRNTLSLTAEHIVPSLHNLDNSVSLTLRDNNDGIGFDVTEVNPADPLEQQPNAPNDCEEPLLRQSNWIQQPTKKARADGICPLTRLEKVLDDIREGARRIREQKADRRIEHIQDPKHKTKQ